MQQPPHRTLDWLPWVLALMMAFSCSVNPAQLIVIQPLADDGKSVWALRRHLSNVSFTRAVHCLLVSPSVAHKAKTSPRTSPIWSRGSFSGNLLWRASHTLRSPSSMAISSSEKCSTASKAAPSNNVNSHGPFCGGLMSFNVANFAVAHAFQRFRSFPGSSDSPWKRFSALSSVIAWKPQAALRYQCQWQLGPTWGLPMRLFSLSGARGTPAKRSAEDIPTWPSWDGMYAQFTYIYIYVLYTCMCIYFPFAWEDWEARVSFTNLLHVCLASQVGAPEAHLTDSLISVFLSVTSPVHDASEEVVWM